MKLNILHFSDFHFSQQRVDVCRRIGECLAESTANTPVDAVIFTGDMVQDVSDRFEAAYKIMQRHLGMLEVMADSLILTNAQQRRGFSFEQLQQFLGQTSSEMSSTFQDKRLLLLLDDLDVDNEAFLNSLEHSMRYLPSARFIACMCEDKADKTGTLRLNDKEIPRFYLKGFKKRLI